MAARTSTEAIGSYNTKGTAKVQQAYRHLHIKPEWNNFTGKEYDERKRAYIAPSYAPWSKVAWFAFPLNALKHPANNMAVRNDDPSLRDHTDFYHEFFALFCTFGFIASRRREWTEDDNSAFPRCVATASVPHFHPDTGVLVEDPKDGKPKVVIFNFSYAVSPTELNDEDKVKMDKSFNPEHVLVRRLNKADADCVGHKTGDWHMLTSRGMKQPSGRNGGGTKKGLSDYECEQDQYFQKLDRDRWHFLVDRYMSGGKTLGARGHGEHSSLSYYNFWKVFSYENMIRNCVNLGVPEEYFQLWAHPTRRGKFQYPDVGKHTCRFDQSDYDPSRMFVSYLPFHVKPVDYTFDNPTFVRYFLRYFNHIPKNEQEIMDMDPVTRQKFEDAKIKANYWMLRTVNDTSSDDGSLEAGYAAIKKEKLTMEARHKKFEQECKLVVDSPEHIDMRSKQEEEKLTWERAKIDELLTRFSDSNKALAISQRATARWINSRVANKTKGPFNLPHVHKFRNLTEFGNILATGLFFKEAIGKSYITHRASFITELAAKATWIGNEDDMCPHCMLLGEAGKGKSRVLKALLRMMIPDTCKEISSTSSKAEMYQGNDGMEGMVIITDEADPEKWGVGNNQTQGLRGQQTASHQANSGAAAKFREIMSSGTITYERLIRDPKTGEVVPERIVIPCKCTCMANSNCHKSDIARNHLDRVIAIIVGHFSRHDVSFSHMVASEGAPDLKKQKEMITERFQRDQALINWFCILTKAGLLPPVDLFVTEQYMMHLQAKMAERGSKKGDNEARAMGRMRQLIRCLVYHHAIYIMFDSPQRIFADDEEWTKASWYKLMQVRYLLKASAEHLIFVFTLLADEWEDPLMSEVIKAWCRYYKMNITPQEVRVGPSQAELDEAKRQEERRSRNSGGRKKAEEYLARHGPPVVASSASRLNRTASEEIDEAALEAENQYKQQTENAHSGGNFIGGSLSGLMKLVDISQIEVKRRPNDPENLHRPGTIKVDEQNQFFYFVWNGMRMTSNVLSSDPSQQKLSVDTMNKMLMMYEQRRQGGNNDPNSPLFDEGGSTMSPELADGRQIDKLVMHLMTIMNKVGGNSRFVKAVILEMMNTMVQVSGSARSVDAIKWFVHNGTWYLRVSKVFMVHQQESLVKSCIGDLIHSYGLNQKVYVLGEQHPDKPYIWRTLTVDPKIPRRPLKLVNPFFASETVKDLIEDLVYPLNEKRSTTGRSDIDIRYLAEMEQRSVRELVWNASNTHMSISRFFAMIQVDKLGYPYVKEKMVDYKGRSLEKHIMDPENWAEDHKGIEMPLGYHSMDYDVETLDLYKHKKQFTEQESASSVLRIAKHIEMLSDAKAGEAGNLRIDRSRGVFLSNLNEADTPTSQSSDGKYGLGLDTKNGESYDDENARLFGDDDGEEKYEGEPQNYTPIQFRQPLPSRCHVVDPNEDDATTIELKHDVYNSTRHFYERKAKSPQPPPPLPPAPLAAMSHHGWSFANISDRREPRDEAFNYLSLPLIGEDFSFGRHALTTAPRPPHPAAASSRPKQHAASKKQGTKRPQVDHGPINRYFDVNNDNDDDRTTTRYKVPRNATTTPPRPVAPSTSVQVPPPPSSYPSFSSLLFDDGIP